jgi:hypothetical protein
VTIIKAAKLKRNASLRIASLVMPRGSFESIRAIELRGRHGRTCFDCGHG